MLQVIGDDNLYIGSYLMYLGGSLKTTEPQERNAVCVSEGHTI